MAEKKEVGASKKVLTKRDIVVAIILSLVTCGIYSIYWFIMLNEDVNTLTDDHSMSGGVAFLLSLITCGIYGIYWAYSMGKRFYEFDKENNKDASDYSILYLVLQLFGFGIVVHALLQTDLNRYAKEA